tara:strand:+ start:52 stop:249 length:198 start_codon:yes stop_codon:yes gene_type:complete
MITTQIGGKLFSIDQNYNLITENETISKKDMQEISNSYKGINRIHKPMALIFWVDIKNGNKKNWL